MKKKILSAIVVLIIGNFSLAAQKIYTKNGAVSFFSKAPLENISAENNQVMSVLDPQSGDLQFSVLINAFHFKKSQMEIHFNENYMESGKFPKAAFKGKISDLSKVNFTKDGNYTINVSGEMTIHVLARKAHDARNESRKLATKTHGGFCIIGIRDFLRLARRAIWHEVCDAEVVIKELRIVLYLGREAGLTQNAPERAMQFADLTRA